eukprot:COSAG02_NODE_8218_length_2654_cov_1.867710_3_plen_133_part_00
MRLPIRMPPLASPSGIPLLAVQPKLSSRGGVCGWLSTFLAGIERVRIQDVNHFGPSEHGLHIKTSPTRGAYIRDVAYDNITIGNVQHDYVISLTTSYGGNNIGAGKTPLSLSLSLSIFQSFVVVFAETDPRA